MGPPRPRRLRSLRNLRPEAHRLDRHRALHAWPTRPRTATWPASARSAEAAGLFAAFAHPLVEFVGAHTEHAHTGVVAGE